MLTLEEYDKLLEWYQHGMIEVYQMIAINKGDMSIKDYERERMWI